MSLIKGKLLICVGPSQSVDLVCQLIYVSIHSYIRAWMWKLSYPNENCNGYDNSHWKDAEMQKRTQKLEFVIKF